MESKGELLGQAELRVIAVLDPELRNHASLTERAFNVVGEVITRAPEVPVPEVSQSRKVVTALLVRLSNDLRSGGEKGTFSIFRPNPLLQADAEYVRLSTDSAWSGR